VADIAQGGIALVSAAAGAGLTYWLGALNRRHQEVREDKTRWYEARLHAYGELSQAISAAAQVRLRPHDQQRAEMLEKVWWNIGLGMGPIHLVGSQEAIDAAEKLVAAASRVLFGEPDEDTMQVVLALKDFKTAARQDLGHLSP
jgi:hypothetical protein